jgi:fumarylacetoacetate (FAA) hydrolase family protein
MNRQRDIFPEAALRDGLLVTRLWQPNLGPTVVLLDIDGVYDLSETAATMSALLEQTELSQLRRKVVQKRSLCSISQLCENSSGVRNAERSTGPYLLAPCDLQVVKACGVTFAVSAFERVVEECTHGEPRLAAEIRRSLHDVLNADLRNIKPGSKAAGELKERMLSLDMWSQYLEVAFGPDAEVFTKASPLSAVGYGAEIGIHRMSAWNNPEPEVVLAVNSRGETVGATLGNDVNLRDVEGRSALLLGRAKDNNGSCAIGPAIRLFDDGFTMADVRAAEVTLEVEGGDGFRLEGHSSMNQISRDPLELVQQTIGPHHQYPDGLMLFLGTLFAPIQDRDGPNLGFTHHTGDVVTISAPGLGALINSVNYCDAIPPWTFGIGQLFRNLQERGLVPL